MGRRLVERPRSSLHLVDLDYLEGGVAHLPGGVQRAALRVAPLDLTLKSDAERDQVWRRYRQLLAELAGPVSLYSSSWPAAEASPLPQNESAGAGPEWLREQERALRLDLIRDHQVQLQEHLIVVSGRGSAPLPLGRSLTALAIRGARRQADAQPAGGAGLEQRCESLTGALTRLGSAAARLSDGEWLAQLQRHASAKSGLTPASFVSWLAPPVVEVRPREVRIGELWSRSLFLSDYPRRVRIGWLAPTLRGLGCRVDLAQHVVPVPRILSLSRLRRRIRGFETSLVVDRMRGSRPDRETESALEDALGLEDQVLVERERLFQLEVYLTLTASGLPLLERCWQELLAACAEVGCSVIPLTHRQVDGWRATAPLGLSPFSWGRDMTAGALATCLPFLRSGLSSAAGVLLGPSLTSRQLVLLDPFERANPNFNVVVLGTSGGGKSYTAKLLATRLAQRGCRLCCVDPMGEYRALVSALGGQLHDVVPGRHSGLSALRPRGAATQGDGPEALAARAAPVLELLVTAGRQRGGLGEDDREALEAALIEVYRSSAEPRLTQLVSSLVAVGQARLARRLSRFSSGTLAGVFDAAASVAAAAGAVDYSLAGWSDGHGDLLAPAVHMILLELEAEAEADPHTPRLLVVDEAELLLQVEASARALEALSRRVRKLGAGLMVISQVVEDFLGSPTGNVIVRNCHTKVLLRQEEVALPSLRRAFGLSPVECDLLRDAEPGAGLVLVGRERAAFRGAAPEGLHPLLCTDARGGG